MTYKPPTHGVKVFIVRDESLEIATEQVTREVNDWIAAHNWQRVEGGSAHTLGWYVTEQASPDGTVYVVMVHLTGPLDPTTND